MGTSSATRPIASSERALRTTESWQYVQTAACELASCHAIGAPQFGHSACRAPSTRRLYHKRREIRLCLRSSSRNAASCRAIALSSSSLKMVCFTVS